MAFLEETGIHIVGSCLALAMGIAYGLVSAYRKISHFKKEKFFSA